MDIYYLYRHIRVDKNEPFYIGIGTLSEKGICKKQRYERAYSRNNRTKHWKNIVNVCKYDVEILFETSNRKFIGNKEREFVKLYGRRDLGTGTLVNLTDGGEENYTRTEENKLYGSKNPAAQPVIQYEKSGKLVAKYDSIVEAVSKSGVSFTKISDCINLSRVDSSGGYMWIKYNGKIPKNITPYKTKYNNSKKIPVYQYTKELKFLRKWKGTRDVERVLNINHSNISKCTRGIIKSAGGFIWKNL